MAKAKIINISGPMDVKHVGGVNLVTINGPKKDSRYPTLPSRPIQQLERTNTTLMPMEIPMRSNTLPRKMPRPGLPSNNSTPIMRSESLRQLPETRPQLGSQQFPRMPLARSNSVTASSIVPLQPSMPIRRKRLGHERTVSEPVATQEPVYIPESASIPEEAPASGPLFTSRPVPIARPVPISRPASIPELASSPEPPSSPESASPPVPAPILRPLFMHPISITRPIPSTEPFPVWDPSNISKPVTIVSSSDSEQESTPDPLPKDDPKLRSRNPLARFAFNMQPQTQTAPVAATNVMRWPTRQKRQDSRAAMNLDHLPAQERPVPFKEIQSVHSFEDRMAMYKKSREYWATANHGLAEWTQRAGGLGPVAA